MTQNQIAYQALLETQRANQAKEAENYRSNTAKEQETQRSNIAKELETKTHNTNTEYLDLLGKLSDPVAATVYAASKFSKDVGLASGRDFMTADYSKYTPSIYKDSDSDSNSNSARGR